MTDIASIGNKATPAFNKNQMYAPAQWVHLNFT